MDWAEGWIMNRHEKRGNVHITVVGVVGVVGVVIVVVVVVVVVVGCGCG